MGDRQRHAPLVVDGVELVVEGAVLVVLVAVLDVDPLLLVVEPGAEADGAAAGLGRARHDPLQLFNEATLDRRKAKLDVVISDHDDQLVARGHELAQPLEHAGVALEDPVELLHRLAFAEGQAELLLVGAAALAGEDHHRHEVDHVAVDHQAPRPSLEAAVGVVGEERLQLALQLGDAAQV